MNNVLFKQLNDVDGRYLKDAELSTVQDFVGSYTQRINVYRYLQEHKDALILKTLRSLMTSHRQVIQQHGEICKRDLGHFLRYVALSILKDDEQEFIEALVLWMQNILFSMKRDESCVGVYIALQSIISEEMLPDEAALVNHYVSIFIDALKVGKG
ncbi:MAG: hypothetical protein AAGA75_08650 [Cyanobacteria bacterium P01_E01_bin.6]